MRRPGRPRIWRKPGPSGVAIGIAEALRKKRMLADETTVGRAALTIDATGLNCGLLAVCELVQVCKGILCRLPQDKGTEALSQSVTDVNLWLSRVEEQRPPRPSRRG